LQCLHPQPGEASFLDPQGQQAGSFQIRQGQPSLAGPAAQEAGTWAEEGKEGDPGVAGSGSRSRLGPNGPCWAIAITHAKSHWKQQHGHLVPRLLMSSSKLLSNPGLLRLTDGHLFLGLLQEV
jgi:hypothetical protein